MTLWRTVTSPSESVLFRNPAISSGFGRPGRVRSGRHGQIRDILLPVNALGLLRRIVGVVAYVETISAVLSCSAPSGIPSGQRIRCRSGGFTREGHALV